MIHLSSVVWTHKYLFKRFAVKTVVCLGDIWITYMYNHSVSRKLDQLSQIMRSLIQTQIVIFEFLGCSLLCLIFCRVMPTFLSVPYITILAISIYSELAIICKCPHALCSNKLQFCVEWEMRPIYVYDTLTSKQHWIEFYCSNSSVDINGNS